MTDCYVAGPMRGIDLWNFPAFRLATDYLRAVGCSVISPHELDEAVGFTEDSVDLPEGFMAGAMRRDIEALLDVDTIVLLPGWVWSTGARFELSVAEMLGLSVWTFDPDEVVGSRILGLTWPEVHDRVAAADEADEERWSLTGKGRLALVVDRFADTGDDANPKDLVGQAKPQLHLVPKAFIIRVAQAMADGARKYGPFNWRTKKVKASVYVSALERHVGAWFDGEDIAGDSGVHHLGHAGACIGILVDAIETGNLIDDRPPPGAAARLVVELTEAVA